MRRDRISLLSGNVLWYCQASLRLSSANAKIYLSMSSGSVNIGFAVRRYCRRRREEASDKEIASMILEV